MDKVKEEACTHGRTENKHRSFLTSLQLEYLTHKRLFIRTRRMQVLQRI